MLVGRHNLLGKLQVRNEDQSRYTKYLTSGIYEVTLTKAQLLVYLDWIKRGRIVVKDAHAEYERLKNYSSANVLLPIKDVRIEKS